MLRTALALVAALPLTALAQEAGPPVEDPRWSIGAGVTLFETFFSGGPGIQVPGTFLFVSAPGVPVVRASLERRIGAATWLVAAVSGSLSDQEEHPSLGFAFPSIELTSSGHTAYVSAGLRRDLTSSGAPAIVSVFGLVEGGVARQETTATFSDGRPESTVDTSRRLAGISAGFAAERALGAGISVRISSTLLRAAAFRDRSEMSGEAVTGGTQTEDTRTRAAGLTLEPRLELRLAF